MSDDKQKEILDGYEQLKRKNRRRLVGVSGLVLISSVLLGSALNMGKDKDKADTSAIQVASNEANSPSTNGELSKAAVLEPTSDDAPVVEANNKRTEPENIGTQKTAADKTNTVAADTEEPLVLINDKLVDSDIKGLEESERIQKAEAAKREAEEMKAQERKEQLAQQKMLKRKEIVDEAAEKRRVQLAKLERDAIEKKQVQAEKVIERKAVKPSEIKSTVVAERDIKKEIQVSKAKEAVSHKAEVDRVTSGKVVAQKAEKINVESPKSVKVKTEKVKEIAKPVEQVKTKAIESKSGNGKKTIIQAGYPEKERALSLQRKMKDAGIKAGIVEVNTDKGKVYRVKTGAYSSREAAGRDLEKMRVHGIGGAVVDE